MKAKTLMTVVLASAVWTSPGAQPQKERCGTRQPNLEEVEQIEQRIARVQEVEGAGHGSGMGARHHQGSGFANGELSEDAIRSQVRVLDDSFSGRTGGAGTGFDFQLAGVTRTINKNWFEKMATDIEVELAAKTSLKRGGAETLNIYTVDGGPYLGFAYFPNIVTSAEFAVLDGVVLDWRSLPGGTFEIYSEGDTAPHEVGHWLALFHTFDGKCGTKGDYVADTPAEFAPAFGCPIGRDTLHRRLAAGPRPDLQLHGLHAGFLHVHVHARPGRAHAGGLDGVPGRGGGELGPYLIRSSRASTCELLPSNGRVLRRPRPKTERMITLFLLRGI